MKHIEFYTYNSNDDEYIITQEELKEFNLTEDVLKENVGESLKLQVIELNPATHRNALEIEKLCLVEDKELGLKRDSTKEFGARIKVLVESWTLNVDKENYEDLSLTLSNYIYALLDSHLFPNKYNSPFFSQLLTAKLKK